MSQRENGSMRLTGRDIYLPSPRMTLVGLFPIPVVSINIQFLVLFRVRRDGLGTQEELLIKLGR